MEKALIEMKTTSGKCSNNEVLWNKGVGKTVVQSMRDTC